MTTSPTPALTAELLRALRSIVGPGWVRHRPAELATYAADGLPTHQSRPGLVVLPGSKEEVAAVLRLLAEHRVPFVPRGAGTGLSGGALAAGDAVLLTLTRLNRILRIDPANRRAVVEPGVINAQLGQAAARFGLHYLPDPSSQTACTIGGNVAENAGGPHCLKYGVTTNHVTDLEVILPDGSTARIGSPQGEPWGPDLVGLFLGSEGMFGVAVEITVRLEPIPREIRTLFAEFTALRAASSAVSAIIASGIVPAALEMMDQSCLEAVEASIYATGARTDAAAILIVEVDGAPEAVAAEAAIVEPLLRANGARSVTVATSEADRARLWLGRKKAFGALGRLAPDLAVQDAVVPRSALPDLLDHIASVRDRLGLRISNVFHAGDGNLHPCISFDHRDPGQSAAMQTANREIMEACLAAGGSITGEHGVGSDKREYMPRAFQPAALDVMCEVRRVFDPDGRANPGKVFPAHVCREWRSGDRR